MQFKMEDDKCSIVKHDRNYAFCTLMLKSIERHEQIVNKVYNCFNRRICCTLRCTQFILAL